MKLILLGPPGAGKGTQAKKLEQYLKIKHISTGDIFRNAIHQKTELGRKAKQYIDKGLLVPDDIVVAIVKQRIQQDDCEHGFILDGFPRTVNQAQALSNITEIDYVINIQVSQQELIKRLTGRRICSKCGSVFHLLFSPPHRPDICDNCGGKLYQREDDKQETVNKRLEVYQNQTSPLIKYYQQKGMLLNIDGTLDVEHVFRQIIQLLGGN